MRLLWIVISIIIACAEANRVSDRAIELIYNGVSQKYKEKPIALQKTNEYILNLQLSNVKKLPEKLCSLENNKAFDVSCDQYKNYRSFNGVCNNLLFKYYGAGLIPFKRFLQPLYDDGLQSSRSKSYVKNKYLPNPRLVASTYFPYYATKSDASNIYVDFAAFVSEDIVQTRKATKQTMEGTTQIECDCNLPDSVQGECLSINVPQYDYFRTKGVDCLSFVRSEPSIVKFDCNLGPREQLNLQSSFLDLSSLYGTTIQLPRDTTKSYLLASVPTASDGHYFTYKDPANAGTCPFKGVPPYFNLGDERSATDSKMISQRTIFLRLHNIIAEGLAKLATGAPDNDRIFQIARKINIGFYQRVIYNEFLFTLLGNYYTNHYGLKVYPGQHNTYNPQLNPSAYNEFVSAGFRLHHLVSEDQCYADKSLIIQKCGNLTGTAFDVPNICNNVNNEIRGSLRSAADFTNSGLAWSLNNNLYNRHESIGTLNIMRGRDHGLPGYNAFRQLCGLGLARNFYDLKQIPVNKQKELQKLYLSVDDIDLWVGGASETPIYGSRVGPTFACLIGHQFRDLKHGDRYFYQTTDPTTGFTTDQLKEIEKIDYAEILCLTVELNSVAKYAFLLPNRQNPIYHCQNYKPLNFDAWKNEVNGL